MVYAVAWDEAEPDGTEQASTLDTEIQNLKISMRERLEDLINDWSDDGVDPKTFNKTALAAATSRVRLSRSIAQSIATGSDVSVQWTDENVDVGDYFDSAVSTTNIVIPTGETGLYLVTAGGRFTSIADTTFRSIGLWIDGTNVAGNVRAGVSGFNMDLTFSWVGTLTAAEVVTIRVRQESAGALDFGNPFASVGVVRLA